MKKNMKKNGFTLVEILAVVIILGILMIIAVPAVSKYVNDSRKSTYILTAKEYIDMAKLKLSGFEYSFYDKDMAYYIPISEIPLEEEGNSPFGDWQEAYVVVTYTKGDGWKYYWTSVDTAGMKVDVTLENDLDESKIYSDSNLNLDELPSSVGRSKLCIVGKDSC